MRLNDLPRFLLFSDSVWRADGSGRWRFRVESLSSGRAFEARGDELAANRDRLDLWALVRGLESFDQPSHVTLLTGSQYLGRGLRFGLPTWRERDWCWESYGRWTAVRDADLWRRIDTALHYHQVDCRVWSFANANSACDEEGFESELDGGCEAYEPSSQGRRPNRSRNVGRLRWADAVQAWGRMFGVLGGVLTRSRRRPLSRDAWRSALAKRHL